MQESKAFLFLNGSKPEKAPKLNDTDFICAVDGSIDWCAANLDHIDLYCGDFDSSDSKGKNAQLACEIIHTPDQNKTDFEKALELLIEKGFKKVLVYGSSGLEQDHYLGNLSTVLNLKSSIDVEFNDDYTKSYFIDKSTRIPTRPGMIISLVPFPRAEQVYTQGLKYALQGETLVFGEFIGTRNQAVEQELVIEFEQGEILIFLHHEH